MSQGVEEIRIDGMNYPSDLIQWLELSKFGQFLGVNDKFLGVKFLIGSNTHYGWARLDVTAGADTIRLKDYAYSQNADLPILAGQTLGLDDVAVENKVTIKTTQTYVTRNY